MKVLVRPRALNCRLAYILDLVIIIIIGPIIRPIAISYLVKQTLT